jgi:hypothetical protein
MWLPVVVVACGCGQTWEPELLAIDGKSRRDAPYAIAWLLLMSLRPRL